MKNVISEFAWTLLKISLGLILGLLLFSTVGCADRRIAHTRTKREIRKAMRYSTSEYVLPCITKHHK